MKTKQDTAKALAEEIKRRWPELEVKVEMERVNTDSDIRGTRLRRPGKGRRGSRIIVRDPKLPRPEREIRPLLDHRNGETYRRLSNVRRWIEDRILDEEKEARRAAQEAP